MLSRHNNQDLVGEPFFRPARRLQGDGGHFFRLHPRQGPAGASALGLGYGLQR